MATASETAAPVLSSVKEAIILPTLQPNRRAASSMSRWDTCGHFFSAASTASGRGGGLRVKICAREQTVGSSAEAEGQVRINRA